MINERMKELTERIYENLTDEQKEKAKQCKTMDELMAFAGQEGVELPDEALDHVSGGCESQCSEDDMSVQCGHVY